jgi:hypothetical protein
VCNNAARGAKTRITLRFSTPRKPSTHLFHHPTRLEFIAVRQATDQAPLALSVDPQPGGLPAGTTERLALRFGRSGAVSAGGIGLIAAIVARAPVARAAFLGLAIEQEIAQYPAWAPKKAVRPTLDAALVLVKDENGAGGDHLALRVDEAAGDAGDHSAAGGFEDEEGITGGLYPA